MPSSKTITAYHKSEPTTVSY